MYKFLRSAPIEFSFTRSERNENLIAYSDQTTVDLYNIINDNIIRRKKYEINLE